MSKPPASTQHETLADELIEAVIRLATAWRVELCLFTLPAGLGAWLYFRLGLGGAIVIIVLVVLAAVLPPPLRRLLSRILHRASVRRHLDVAYASMPGLLSERRPVIGTVVRTPFGDRVALALRHGTSADDLVRAEAVVAASLGVREVRAVAEASQKNRVTLSIIRRDPFESAALPTPLIKEERMNGWNPIPIGLDEEGRIVFLSLVEHNLLIGGEPGAGKSVALSGVVAASALDPNVDMWLFDGKMVELGPWRSCAQRFVGPDVEAAVSALQDLREVMDHRYGQLLDRGVRKVSIGDHLRLQLVVIDEMALYVAGVDKKLATRFSELLRDLVA
ncbi:MAG TPA: FtsK/SpoIIIE domain-containing protein, partial [Acidimicrobiales bacterium]|nr:FtsK/SpoIIIE domain-containing protein [Acidimicrobiales bacterium]